MHGDGDRLVLISSIATPQDAHKCLVLQVYLGSNTLEFSAIFTHVGRSFVSKLM